MSEPVPIEFEPDDEELQLPVHGLFADLELGRGSVLLPDEFLQCSGLLQLQIIDQWQQSLARCRNNALRLLWQEELAAVPPAKP